LPSRCLQLAYHTHPLPSTSESSIVIHHTPYPSESSIVIHHTPYPSESSTSLSYSSNSFYVFYTLQATSPSFYVFYHFKQFRPRPSMPSTNLRSPQFRYTICLSVLLCFLLTQTVLYYKSITSSYSLLVYYHLVRQRHPIIIRFQ
jgi:hypothetical protein